MQPRWAPLGPILLTSASLRIARCPRPCLSLACPPPQRPRALANSSSAPLEGERTSGSANQ
eukprot:7042895-Pyramimonas_sp.AAC.1